MSLEQLEWLSNTGAKPSYTIFIRGEKLNSNEYWRAPPTLVPFDVKTLHNLYGIFNIKSLG